MFEGKYNKVIIVVGIILIIIIILLLGYLGVRVMNSYNMDDDQRKAASDLENKILENKVLENSEIETNTIDENYNIIDPNTNEVISSTDLINSIISDGNQNNNNNNNNNSNNSSSTANTKKYTYKGFNMVGTIEIPKIELKCPILEYASNDAIEVAVAIYAGVGLNKVGNTTITGHNYKNGTFFSNNYKLLNGDKVYITDTSGKKVTYTIYKIYKTTPEDIEYNYRDTQGRREISLTTCTDDTKNRLIIWAKAD